MALEFCHRIPKTIGVSGAGEGSFLNTLSTPLWLRGKESPSFGGAEEGGGVFAEDFDEVADGAAGGERDYVDLAVAEEVEGRAGAKPKEPDPSVSLEVWHDREVTATIETAHFLAVSRSSAPLTNVPTPFDMNARKSRSTEGTRRAR